MAIILDLDVKRLNRFQGSANRSSMAYLPNSKKCFVCGEENPAGLHVRFFVEDGLVKARWRPQAQHCGLANVVHGGVTATLLDECMAWAAGRSFGRMCVTGELNVRFLRRVPGDQELLVCAEVVRPGRRIAHVQGRLVDATGEACAESYGRFVPVSTEETLAVDEALLYRDGDERPFAALRAKPAPGADG